MVVYIYYVAPFVTTRTVRWRGYHYTTDYIAIYGCIDGFSRNFIWLEVDKNPTVIAGERIGPNTHSSRCKIHWRPMIREATYCCYAVLSYTI